MTELRTRGEIAHSLEVLASAVVRENCGDWVFDDDVSAVAQASAMASALEWVLGHDNGVFLGVLAKAKHGLSLLEEELKG